MLFLSSNFCFQLGKFLLSLYVHVLSWFFVVKTFCSFLFNVVADDFCMFLFKLNYKIDMYVTFIHMVHRLGHIVRLLLDY